MWSSQGNRDPAARDSETDPQPWWSSPDPEAGQQGQSSDPAPSWDAGDFTAQQAPAPQHAHGQFLAADPAPVELPRAEPGPEYSYHEADREAHRFLAALAAGRETERREDPLEHVLDNQLLMLFSPEVTAAFAGFMERMPEPRRQAWAELLSGGVRADAFGPLTLAERRDEREVAIALAKARRVLIVNTALGVIALAVVAVGGWFGYRTFIAEEARTAGAIRFAEPADAGGDNGASGGAVAGGAPVADPELTVSLTESIAVLRGQGTVEERVVVPPLDRLPYPPGSLRVSLFEYAGDGYAAIVGPDGFAHDACLRVSVVTEDLRPLDTVTHGPCDDPVGRAPVVACIGPTALLVGIDIPSGAVELPEGGTGFADAVRVQLVADPGDDYESLTLRGAIEVSAENVAVIPRFGGAPGERIVFDLPSGGTSRTGECTLTAPAA